MSQFGAKNTPWGRPVAAQQLNPQLFTGQLGLAAAAAQQFAVPQAAVQLGPAGLGVGNLGGIPAVNAAAFSSAPQTLGVNAVARAQPQMALQQQPQAPQPSKNQRAFVGVVTKLQENYGFVDDDVFFQTSVVRGAMPRVNERVMVEANYNPNMPFKWNAFRIQLLPNQDGPPAVQQVLQQQQARPREDRWGPAPQAPMMTQGGSGGTDYRTTSRDRSPAIRRERRERSPPPRRPSPVHRRSPPRRRSPSPRRHGSVQSSSSIGHKRERSPRRSSPRDRDSGGGSRSPPRRRARIIPRYNVQVPKISMDVRDISVLELKKRYPSMYVPSDFFHSVFSWQDTFPPQRPFSLDHSSSYHVMHKDVDCLAENNGPLDPADADHRYCAKVMLLSTASLAEMYFKSLGIKGDGSVDEEVEPTNPSRLINFLVGLRGKSEVLAIGGPWSPSLDGENPESDPRVLVRTAVRTTLALTGMDLSKCTQWYKFLELRYRRVEKEKSAATGEQPVDREPRVDTVVIFMPDVWNLLPTKLEFEGLQSLLKKQLETKIAALDQQKEPVVEEERVSTDANDLVTENAETDTDGDKQQEQEQQDQEESANSTGDSGEATSATEETPTPTHYSKLDFKSMKVVELRTELGARGLDTKGVKSVLVTRLQQAAKEEEEVEEKKVETKTENHVEEKDDDITILEEDGKTEEKEKVKDANPSNSEAEKADTKVESEESKKKRELDEKEKQRQKEKQEKEKKEKKASLERHYTMPSNATPGILVFPHKTAKGGKFDCKVISLSSLLDYRQDDNKEHSFEVALFAEVFNEMLTRDCAFTIYKALLAAPSKESEKKDKKEQKTEDKNEDAGDEKEQKSSEEEATQKQTENDDTEKMDTSEPPAENGDVKQEAEANQAEKEKQQTKPKEDSKKEKDVKEKDKKSSSKDKDDSSKKNVVLIKDPALFFAFAFFDQSHCGYLFTRDAEEILYTMGLRLSRAQVQRVLKKTVTRDTLNYRKFIDTVVSKDTKEVKVEPGLLDITSESVVAAGNILLSGWKESSGVVSSKIKDGTSDGAPDVSESPTVMFQGSIVDVSQILDQLKRLEREQQNMEQRNNSLEKELKNTKDRVSGLEKKKRRLEDDADRYKKRYQDAEKCLKTSQDDTVQLKTALQECKKMGEKIAHVVDKALPSVRDEKERSKSRSVMVADSPVKGEGKTAIKKEEQKPKAEQDESEVVADMKQEDSLEKKLDKALENAVKEEESENAVLEEMTVQDEVVEAEDDKPEADMTINQ